jgi:hypothetical protein
MRLTEVLRLWGQSSIHPSGVALQAKSRINRLISLSPRKFQRGPSAGRATLRSGWVFIYETLLAAKGSNETEEKGGPMPAKKEETFGRRSLSERLIGAGAEVPRAIRSAWLKLWQFILA